MEKKEEKKEKREMPAHITTFDPEDPPYEIQRLCLYLRELEEEKEKQEGKERTEPTLHK